MLMKRRKVRWIFKKKKEKQEVQKPEIKEEKPVSESA